jgi:hypothetical protein
MNITSLGTPRSEILYSLSRNYSSSICYIFSRKDLLEIVPSIFSELYILAAMLIASISDTPFITDFPVITGVIYCCSFGETAFNLSIAR